MIVWYVFVLKFLVLGGGGGLLGFLFVFVLFCFACFLALNLLLIGR